MFHSFAKGPFPDLVDDAKLFFITQIQISTVNLGVGIFQQKMRKNLICHFEIPTTFGGFCRKKYNCSRFNCRSAKNPQNTFIKKLGFQRNLYWG